MLSKEESKKHFGLDLCFTICKCVRNHDWNAVHSRLLWPIFHLQSKIMQLLADQDNLFYLVADHYESRKVIKTSESS